MNAFIIVAIVLIAAGLLISVILWLRASDSAESEYVTVAELRARLEHEHEPTPDAAAGQPDEPIRTETHEPTPEPETQDSSAAADIPEESVHPETGALPATELTGAEDEPEILGPATRKTTEETDPDGGEEPVPEQPDRNH